MAARATRNPLAAALASPPPPASLAHQPPPAQPSPPPPQPSLPLQRLAALRAQVEGLRTRVEALQQAKLDSIDWRATGYAPEECSGEYDFKLRTRLNGGHSGRVTALSWAGDNTTLASVATDGMLVLWNAVTGVPDCVVELPEDDIPAAVDVERDSGAAALRVVVGGLNQACHVYTTWHREGGQVGGLDLALTLPPARSFLSCVRVMGHDRVLAGGGDGEAVVWDLTTAQDAARLRGGGGPVLCAAVLPQSPEDTCVTGSADGRLRVWDTRLEGSRACVLAFGGFVGGVAAVDFFPGGTAVAGGGEDSTVRLFDLRACGPVGVYAYPKMRVGVTGVAFSASGALLFAAYEDPVCIAWEPMSAEGVLHELVGDFTAPVTCLAANGLAVALGGGEGRAVVWA